MRIISRAALKKFWLNRRYQDSEHALKSWYDEVKQAEWKTPQDVKNKYRHASILGNNRIVFNIHGNTYRLVVAMNYDFGLCYIRFIGTHKQYDEIDATTI